ncbi:unnamed protein product, partial [Owenia fusiformis]
VLSNNNAIQPVFASIYEITGRYNLLIRRVQDNRDFTYFTCRELQASLVSKASVIKAIAPSQPLISGADSVIEGSDAVLTCSSSGGVEAPDTKWFTEGNPITVGVVESRNTNWKTDPGATSSSVLTLSKVTKDLHEKMYECRLNNTATSDLKATITLDVKYKPGTATSRGNVEVNEQETATLRCNHPSDRGNPRSTFKWFKGASDTPFTDESSATLTISSATVDNHDDTYRCTPTNSAGDGISASVTLTVRAKPAMSKYPTGIVDAINTQPLPDNVKCIDKAKPGSSYKWYLNGSEITGSNSIYQYSSSNSMSGKWTTTTSSLSWKSGSSEAQRKAGSGSVKCEATNTAGDDEKTFNINIQYKPGTATSGGNVKVNEEETATLRCNHPNDRGNPQSTFKWFKGDSNTPLTDQSSATLTISSATVDDHDDTYKCTPTNSAG